jgi:capsule polysaccharide export protein KpsC/LpsZ
MTKEEVPGYMSNGNKNIVLFNSSDDEFAALGEEYKNPFFENQNEGLEFLTALFGERLKEYNLIIRMHPNLTGVKHEFVNKIRNLHQKHPNIYVVTPESVIDSYSMMEHAQKVISFGSTTGLEANFLQKPVILLGKGIYFYSEVAYIPENKEEIEALITSNLEPKPILDTLKFGFYFLKSGTKSRYYQETNREDGVFFKKKGVHSFTILQRIKARIIQKAFQFFRLRLKL